MSTKKAPYHQCCTVMRTVLISYHSFDMATGATIEHVKPSEWATQPCNTPLFGADTAVGKCRSCQRGWTHPNNYPADQPRPIAESEDVFHSQHSESAAKLGGAEVRMRAKAGEHCAFRVDARRALDQAQQPFTDYVVVITKYANAIDAAAARVAHIGTDDEPQDDLCQSIGNGRDEITY